MFRSGGILLVLCMLTTLPAVAGAFSGKKPFEKIPLNYCQGIFQTQEDSTIEKRSPKGAMVRSMIFPGWGQLYNGKKLKSLLVFSAEAGCIAGYIYERDRLNNSSEEWEKEFYRDERNKYAWWLAGVMIYSMLDSFIDAYLDNFENNMDINITQTDFNNITVQFTFSPSRLFRR